MKTNICLTILAASLASLLLFSLHSKSRENNEKQIIHSNSVRLSLEIQNNHLGLEEIADYIDPNNELSDDIEAKILLEALRTSSEQAERKKNTQ